MLRDLHLVRRFRALVRADPAGVRAGFVAHLLATATGLAAGLILGSITGTLQELPGLLVLVPAAVGLRGNVFGALGSRLGTLVAIGEFRLSRRRDTEVGQNLLASVALSFGLSLLLALIAKGVAEGLGVRSVVNSPTFIIVNEHAGRLPLFHVDAYRLIDADEARHAGVFDERQVAGVTVIEWADRLAGWLPSDRLEVEIEPDPTDVDHRLLRWTATGRQHRALAGVLEGRERP